MEIINAVSIAYSFGCFGIEIEIDQAEPINQSQVDASIAALNALPSRIVTPAQLGAAIAMLNCLPPKPTNLEGGRQVPAETAAKFVPQYRIRAQMVNGCSIE